MTSLSYRIGDETLPGELELMYVGGNGNRKVHRVCVNGSLVHVKQVRLQTCKWKMENGKWNMKSHNKIERRTAKV